MRKKLLFVIDSLTIGGAEKSLVSLLNLIDYTKFEVDLLMLKRGGDFEEYLPGEVNILPTPQYFSYLAANTLLKSKHIKYLYYRSKTSIKLRLNNLKGKQIHGEQVVYDSVQRILPPIPKDYDVAIAYSQGMPTYYVANKVTSTKKMAWINTDYSTTRYDKDIDFLSYKKINKIIAVSKHIKESVSTIRREYTDKVEIILDIIDPRMINKMAEEHKDTEYEKSQVNILTVGRLVGVKGYDRAIEAAKLLRSSGYNFKWFFVGEGPDREYLQGLIDLYNLNDSCIFLGKKINPYIYMKDCDVYVQTSIREGFGLTVCEAKILKRPIVCTNFATAKELINSGIDGLIVNHDAESIYKGIKKFIDDKKFKDSIIRELNSREPYSSIDQLQKFYQLIE